MVIDFHTHTFPERISEKTIQKLGLIAHIQPFTTASASALHQSMLDNGVDYSVNLPVVTTLLQAEKVNEAMIAQKDELLSKHIITFGGMHPDYENYKPVLRSLCQAGIPGIKLHPAYQGVDLDDIRMMRIIDYATELGMIVLIHAGLDIGLMDHDYAPVSAILKVMDQVQPDKFVLAHMGGWGNWAEVESDLSGAPLWLDTAFAIGHITPNPLDPVPPITDHNMSEEDFVRICRKHGTDKILFGTDSPWMPQGEYQTRIADSGLNAQESEQIFSGNAIALLKKAGFHLL